jgi:hypothetical protein
VNYYDLFLKNGAIISIESEASIDEIVADVFIPPELTLPIQQVISLTSFGMPARILAGSVEAIVQGNPFEVEKEKATN